MICSVECACLQLKHGRLHAPAGGACSPKARGSAATTEEGRRAVYWLCCSYIYHPGWLCCMAALLLSPCGRVEERSDSERGILISFFCSLRCKHGEFSILKTLMPQVGHHGLPFAGKKHTLFLFPTHPSPKSQILTLPLGEGCHLLI